MLRAMLKSPCRLGSLYRDESIRGFERALLATCEWKRRTQKNCVAYHFWRQFERKREFCPQKKKAAENGGSRPLRTWESELLCGVLILIDAIAHAIGFAVELPLICLGQMAIVRSHVSFFVVLQALFALFEVGSLSGRQLAVLYTVGDAVLLVSFATVDLVDTWMAGIELVRTSAGSVGLLRSGGTEEHQATHCKDHERLAKVVVHARVNPRGEV